MSRKIYDVVVVGAGILGLATAREIHARQPGLSLAVLEKEPAVGRHQSGHNSGVLHAGVYYAPGSLKARLCVQGKVLMERFAEEHGIAVDRCGKLVIAVREDELPRLEELERRARANGVPGVRMLGPRELREVEPHATGLRALYSPGTGIIDFSAVTRAMAEELVQDDVELHHGAEVRAIRSGGDHTVVETSAGEFATRRVISCAGLHADRVARMDGEPEVATMPFRGDYYTLVPEARRLCRGLIYPVPDPSLPFLGVHFTKRHDGEVWAGPNAVLATRREGYRRSDVDLRDLWETVRHPGFVPLARRWWRTGAQEVWRDVVKAAFVRDLRAYVPEIRSDQLVFGPSGVRAQAVAADGRLVDDFTFATTPTSLHVLNAPSPAATASLAIAGHVVDTAEAALGLAELRSTPGSRQTGPRRAHG
ncbi:L-2-hydroxyglutarate oxidase [Auraticoccus sp. F435]|uniref:L-2-hydroxyglutarate oxidase n=1 Tax=Auraticoccus cholistanensis TaxID=2656650 RepID=A0A6A9UX39_9ACTN|nr:L-2-hydroxyglutarate oxidase [Auraticoccus cholistanensis]MVA77271.1 L-2-hydroxyglutarate oxidase [Auraticoccus cholistanensis]